ncbi:MAG: RagB/SusD family nutrient uptake outer membrane protein, partial [Parabacteroides sp.]|nr:RagB/SusD family nutrient uptake outer membrane protein [Parabacteroides sp.]
AFLAKVYLYKAYRQDEAQSHEITSISKEDLQKVVEFTEENIFMEGGYGLETDFHNNFRPEPQFENGIESIWAMQYSMNDGTTNGNLNWSYGLIVPNIPGVTDGGCDFYKPSQNLVNAYRTNIDGLPFVDTFNDKDYDMTSDYADPRLFLTVGIPGLPYMFNTKYMMDESSTWSRSNGLYGYYVTLKQNVDPDCGYLIKGAWWGTPMNRIVFRYADVLLMRAEALAQLNDGRLNEAIDLVNRLRTRAKHSMGMILDYERSYNVQINISNYERGYNQEETLKLIKMERRLEMGMECERFFDLVRWGEADKVLNKYYAEETNDCSIYSVANFTKNKNEYLPVPYEQIAASNGNYSQNIGGW